MDDCRQMDQKDNKLLQHIQGDARLSHSRLGRLVGLSTSAVNERLRKMKNQGVLKKYVAVLNPAAVGLDVCAFIQVLLRKPEDEERFLERVQDLPEVLECHHVTGQFSYLLKVRAPNVSHLELLLRDAIKTLSGVTRTETLIVLSSPKETTELALP